MKKVIVYPGRFQPMLAHHAEVLRQLQAQFPDADVYVGTSDKVEEPKSPFNFAEKQLIASAHGVEPSRVLQAKRPYHKDDYPFDQDNTVIIFAVGEKDLDRFPFSNIDPETGLDMTVRGEPKPKYYQKIDTMKQGVLPMSERGYITLAPTVRTGNTVASASAFRQQFKDAPDKEAAKQLYTQQFGEYNDKVFNLIYDKIVGTNMNEHMNILRQLAGLPVVEGAPVQMAPGYAMNDANRALADIGRIIMDMANQRPMGKGVPDSEIAFQNTMSKFGNDLVSGNIETQADLIDAIKSAGEHAKELAAVTKQAMADYDAGKKANIKGDEVADEEPEMEEGISQVDLSDFYAVDESENEDIEEGRMKDALIDKAESMSREDFVADATEMGMSEDEAAEMWDNTNGDLGTEMAKYEESEVEEAVRDDNIEAEFLNTVQSAIASAQEVAYGDVGEEDIDSAYGDFQKGNFESAAETILQSFSDQDGGEVYEIQGIYDDLVDDFKYLAQSLNSESVEEQVEATANNAMAQALAELRKLAGI